MTGAPSIVEYVNDIKTEAQLRKTIDMLHDAEKRLWVMQITTEGEDDSEKNTCGISMGHAFSFLNIFKMKMKDGSVKDFIMVRNPWGQTSYK